MHCRNHFVIFLFGVAEQNGGQIRNQRKILGRFHVSHSKFDQVFAKLWPVAHPVAKGTRVAILPILGHAKSVIIPVLDIVATRD